jgi:twitching motility protein PilT
MSATLLIEPLLRSVVEHHGSDLHIKADASPRVRIRGRLTPLAMEPMTPEDVDRMILETMDDETKEKFLTVNEADYAIFVPDIGRFRANAFRAQGNVGLIARLVAGTPLTLEQLDLPAVIARLAVEERGMVLVTGPTGSGKTTTLGAMVDRINKSKPVHILTIEDPVEIMHVDQLASINQREVRTDTGDFKVALKAAMRQDPDVILIGEMRDQETVHAAVSAAETGHFVLSTLHTTDAAETINRVIDFFQPHEQKQIRIALAQSLKGIICQRLVPSIDGTGRVCVMEILVNTNRVAAAIMDPEKTHEIVDLVADGSYYGMQTFDQHLIQLVLANAISISSAKMASSKPDDLAVNLKRAGVDPALVDAG